MGLSGAANKQHFAELERERARCRSLRNKKAALDARQSLATLLVCHTCVCNGRLSSILAAAGAEYTPEDAKAAGYSLKEMKDAGYDWLSLVIYLHVTYDELIQLGYTGIDKNHDLFRRSIPQALVDTPSEGVWNRMDLERARAQGASFRARE